MQQKDKNKISIEQNKNQSHSKLSNQNFVDKFEKNLRENKRSEYTIIAYRKDIEQLIDHLKNNKGKFEIVDINNEDIENYFQSLNSNRDYTPKTVSRKLNSTRTFFKYLQNEGLIKENPSGTVIHPKYDSEPPRVLTQREYIELREISQKDLRLSSIIELLLQTGIRIGELCRIQIDDIKLNSKNPYIHISEYSNNISRDIPLNKSAVKALKQYLNIRPKSENKTLFITKNGNPLLVRNIRASIDNMFKKAQIMHAKVNDLRNTFIAHHISKGTDIYIISKLVGHKRISTTEKYIGRIPVDRPNDITLTEL